MGELLTCPIDETPLVMASDDGAYESGCHACRREFRFVRGVLKKTEQTDAKRAGYQTVRLDIHAEHETIVVEDEVFAASWNDVHRDAPITVTQQRGPDGDWQIVRVASGKKTFEPREPGDRAAIRGGGTVLRGALLTVFATALMMYFYHWSFVLLVPFGLVGTALLAGVRFKAQSTRRSFDHTRIAHLEREQWLLTQLRRYRLESSNVDGRISRQSKQIAEMEKLAADMQSAKGDYAHRLEVVQRGITALRSHHDNDRKLADAIARAIEMVEIEYRAARALDYLPDDAIDRLSTTIAELDAIEAENVALEAQLEANAEVHAIAPG